MRYARLTATLAFIALVTGFVLWINSANPSTTVRLAAAQPVHWNMTGWTRSTVPTTVPTVPPTTSTTVTSLASKSFKDINRTTVVSSTGSCTKPSNCPALRQCENGGSYAHGTSSLYDGAYQFGDKSVWGLSPAQQDAHADAMFAARGAEPWPRCGRYLK